MRKPPSSTAVEFELGMPKESSGISVVLATVLLAVSGAATPSGDPLPNSSGVLRPAPRLVVGDEGGDGAAAARRQPLEERR